MSQQVKTTVSHPCAVPQQHHLNIYSRAVQWKHEDFLTQVSKILEISVEKVFCLKKALVSNS